MHWYTWVMMIASFIGSIGHITVNVKRRDKSPKYYYRGTSEYNPKTDPEWHDENGIPY